MGPSTPSPESSLWTWPPSKGSLSSLNTKFTISFLSLPTRVPISANNNTHANRLLDHSRQNTEALWQGGLAPCHHLAYLLGTWQEVFTIPHLCLPRTLRKLHMTLNCHLREWIGKNALSPSGVLLMRSWLNSGLFFENQPSWVSNCSGVTTVPPLLPF
jgi:hypothetical protein